LEILACKTVMKAFGCEISGKGNKKPLSHGERGLGELEI
jgi:hypothetical protein